MTSLLSPADRVLARFYTGPLGHLVGAALDWGELLGRYTWARARGRDPWTS
jgi:hypothetical protein